MNNKGKLNRLEKLAAGQITHAELYGMIRLIFAAAINVREPDRTEFTRQVCALTARVLKTPLAEVQAEFGFSENL